MSKILRSCFSLLAALGFATVLAGQFRGFEAASVLPPALTTVAPGETAEIELVLRIRPGYHINSDKPAEDYLIPTRLEWEADEVEVESISYPEAETVTYSFSEKPLSVFSGEIVIRTEVKAASDLAAAPRELRGKLRYQACNDKACLAPVTVDVAAPLQVKP